MTRIHHYYARYLEHPSGVTDSIDHWARAAADAGWDARILCAEPPAGRGHREPSPLTRTIPHLGRGRGSYVPRGLLRVLRRGDLLVIHEGWVVSNVVAAVMAKVRGARLVVMPHGVYERQIVENQRDVLGLRRHLDRLVLRMADAVHVFYAGEQDVVRAVEPRVARFVTVPNGADPVPDAAAWRGGGDHFVWIGRFDVLHKGLDNLVDAWAGLPEPRPRLILAGPDFQGGRARIAEAVEARGLTGSVELRSHVGGTEKNELLTTCRAYIHPSRWESCSIMLLEALAAGVPSLISRTIHAADELGDEGILDVVDLRGVEGELAAALGRVDGDRELGRRARAWASTVGTWDAVGRRAVDEYRRHAIN
ncbi:GDP-mannose:cellobiosyl-diphosphopolyprenol alpha-mannosyltransferase [Clavibacter michiganensis]|uniref:GDP-mannose:cellobiosyl-diphosphopolyprenol alpha-mannosyltransferase n=1 Tax=Clavibacter michiganensis TaxID=28447 RepID=A0A251Y585_9MICO|nr:glycosyltransferase family 4 protein [Clavibacter michiganensis]OUE19415.1 GDP-mannose:cellobiosyl-diphosphopolyprenol alpha-mannosyltransferase [Clavibacter michiganensis]